MTIYGLRIYDWHELVKALRTVRLRGHGMPLAYKSAAIVQKNVHKNNVPQPVQHYVLGRNVDFIIALRRHILDFSSFDIFVMHGYVQFQLAANGPWIPFLPPIVEVDPTDGAIVCDGLHRIYAALFTDQHPSSISCVEISDHLYSYYARPNLNGWADVKRIEEIPAGYVKKDYREPDNHKALYRDFNVPFPNVQADRPIPTASISFKFDAY